MIEDLKKRLANYFLRKSTSLQEDREMVNLSEVESILVLYAAGSDQEMKEAEKFISRIHNELNISNLEFVIYSKDSRKKIEQNGKKFPKNARVITKDETNFYYRPKTTVMTSTGKNKYDLLIDLSARPSYPLLFITADADAKTKVSRKFEGLEVSDFCLNMKPEHSLTDFTNQVFKYLNIVNKKAV